LAILKREYKIRPAIKFKQKEKKILLEVSELSIFKITVPFELKELKRSKSWLGNGFQNDDIDCHSEWKETVKVYDKDKLSEFIKNCFLSIGINYTGNTNQIIQ